MQKKLISLLRLLKISPAQKRKTKKKIKTRSYHTGIFSEMGWLGDNHRFAAWEKEQLCHYL